MKFLTAQYRGEGESRISLVVQHFEFLGEEICFACMAGRNEWAESLYHWFRREILGKRRGSEDSRLRKMERSLRKQLREFVEPAGREKDELQHSLAGVLCIGDEFWGFEQGCMGIFCLNTAFGKAHMESLRKSSDRGNYAGREIYGGSLQSDVALLLVTTELLQVLGEKQMAESLFVEEMRREWQMYNHLRELGNEATTKGMTDSGAILVRSCKEAKVEEPVDMPSETAWAKGQWMWKPDAQSEHDFGSGRPIEGPQEYHTSCGDFLWGKKLGEGVFARVYKVRHRRMGVVYACKQSEDIAMLWREYCLGLELEHPLFPKVYGFWQEDGVGFLLMEYVPGSTMEELTERRGRFSAEQTIRVGIELAEGLLYLHECRHPYLFRDVKPENIVVRQDGRVKLLDLGCACRKDMWVTSRAGSPGYGAPEQFEVGSVLDVTCDVYSVAKTMQEMLGAGKKATIGRPVKRRIVQVVVGRRERMLRRQLVGICKQCTLAETTRRIPDMRTLLLMLAQLQEKETGKDILQGRRQGITTFWGKNCRCLKNIWERSAEIA